MFNDFLYGFPWAATGQLALAWQRALSAGVCSKLPSLTPAPIGGVESSPQAPVYYHSLLICVRLDFYCSNSDPSLKLVTFFQLNRFDLVQMDCCSKHTLSLCPPWSAWLQRCCFKSKSTASAEPPGHQVLLPIPSAIADSEASHPFPKLKNPFLLH